MTNIKKPIAKRCSFPQSSLLPTIIFAAALFIFTIYTFFPGVMNLDTQYQLQQAHELLFMDWHPPIMGLVWFFLNHIHDGPAVMLVFHNVLFWCALTLFAFWLLPRTNWQRILFIAGVGLFPGVFVQLGTVYKDTGFAATIFLAIVLMLYAEHAQGKSKYFLLMLTLLPLYYACNVRWNALPAIIAIALWWVAIIYQGNWFKQLFLALLLCGAFWGINQTINTRILHAVHVYPFQQVQIHDLAAISVAQKQPLFPKYMTAWSKFNMQFVYTHYKPTTVGSLIFGHTKAIYLTNNPKEIAALDAAWLHNIWHYKNNYLRHRAKIFWSLCTGCRADDGEVCTPPVEGEKAVNNPIYRLLCSVTNVRLLKGGEPGVYFLACLALFIGIIKARKRLVHTQVMLFILSGIILYVGGLLFYATSCEVRFVYWIIIATIVVYSILLKDIFTGNSNKQHDGCKN